MSALLKKKINYNRHNSFRSVLGDLEISVFRNNLTREVSIHINSNPEDGQDQYRLDLSEDQINKLRWLFTS